jgi:tight adherence protein B
MSASLAAAMLAAFSVLATATSADRGRASIVRRRMLRRLPVGPRRMAMSEVVEGGARRVLAWATRSRRARRADEALSDWLDAAARSVRSGGSLAQALAGAAASVASTPLGGDVLALRRAIERGDPLSGALEAFDRASPSPPRQLAVRALILASEVGGAPSAALDGVSATLRHLVGIRGEARALATQARLSAVVIAASPVAFTLVAASVDGRVLAFLVGSPVGLACLALGLGLDALGAWWMARLIGAGS